jgi:hypothetical protein
VPHHRKGFDSSSYGTGIRRRRLEVRAQRHGLVAFGVRSLAIYCECCHHEAVLEVEAWPDHVPVPAFRRRMVCTRCGIIGADVRPKTIDLKRVWVTKRVQRRSKSADLSAFEGRLTVGSGVS